MYLIKWRADYVTNHTNEAVSCWAIEDVKWTYEQRYKNLKMKLKVRKFLKTPICQLLQSEM